MNEIYSQVLVARGQCTTNTHSRLADWQVNIVLKCSNPNRNPKRLVLGLIRVRIRAFYNNVYLPVSKFAVCVCRTPLVDGILMISQEIL